MTHSTRRPLRVMGAMREESVQLEGLASHLEVEVLVDGAGAWASINDTDELPTETLLRVFLGVIPPDVLHGEFPFEKKFNEVTTGEDGERERLDSFERVHATVESNRLVVRHYRDEHEPGRGDELVEVVEASRDGVVMVEPPYTSIRPDDSPTTESEGMSEQECRDTTIIDDYERRIACPFCGGEVNISQVDTDGVVECGEYLPNDMGCGRRLQICVREVDRDDSRTSTDGE